MIESTDIRDSHWMRRALSLAYSGRGLVEPNPLVGAVVIRDGEILGEGYHESFGGPHAEIKALEDVKAKGHDPAGATMYVTLEPCNHTGKTPPCVQTLIEAKIARVVIGMSDPNPNVAGRGTQALRDVGIEVVEDVEKASAIEANQPFIKFTTKGLPWVMLKWAQTLDGAIATAAGDSRWVSNEKSRRHVHEMRAVVDAVMVGVGTVVADDPELTARDVPVRRKARRVIIDRRLRIQDDAKLISQPDPAVLIAADQHAMERDPKRVMWLRRKGVEVLPLIGGEGHDLNLMPLLEHLAREHSATNVLVEGGAVLGGSLLELGLVDQILAFVTPKLVGDDDAIHSVRGLDVDVMNDALPLKLHKVRRFDDDLMLDYRIDPDHDWR